MLRSDRVCVSPKLPYKYKITTNLKSDRTHYRNIGTYVKLQNVNLSKTPKYGVVIFTIQLDISLQISKTYAVHF